MLAKVIDVGIELFLMRSTLFPQPLGLPESSRRLTGTVYIIQTVELAEISSDRIADSANHLECFPPQLLYCGPEASLVNVIPSVLHIVNMRTGLHQ